MKYCSLKNCAAIAALVTAPTLMLAGTLDEDVLVSTSGDGEIRIDETENVVPPGIKAVTFISTRDPDNKGEYLDPYENIITDFSDLDSRGEVTNCLMASNENYCDSEPGSGKRIKTLLYGPGAFDMVLSTTPSTDPAFQQVDYFTFGKISNLTPARITGFSIQVLDADGNLMTGEDAEKVLFNLDATQIGLGAGLVDGLFGGGGQEGEIGFLSDEKAGFSLVASEDVLDFGASADLIANPDHLQFFGDAMLNDAYAPDGFFWDATPDIADDESALLAWYHVGDDKWYYGNLAPAGSPELDEKLAAIAADLGVEVSDLAYTAGGDEVPEAIVAAMEADELFEVDKVEDLRNANLNYTITVGDVESGEFTIRIEPRFAPVVELATTANQFVVAGALDAAAFVPYLDLGNAAAYQAGIAEIMALTGTDQIEALERTNFSFLSAFDGLSLETARNQVLSLGLPIYAPGDSVTMSSNGTASDWQVSKYGWGFLSARGSKSEYDTTATGIGYNVTAGSFNVGYEYRASDRLSFGVQVGAVDAESDAYNGRGSIDANGFALSAFSRMAFGNGGALQAILGFQDLSYDTKRNVFASTAVGDTEGNQVFGAVQTSYMFEGGNGFSFGPVASVEYYNTEVDAFNETGAGAWNLAVGRMSGDITIGTIGIQGLYEMPNFDLSGSLSYNWASGDDQLVQSGFIGLPAPGIQVSGIDEEWLGVGLNIKADVSSNVTLNAGYLGSFGSNYEGHAIQLGAQYAF